MPPSVGAILAVEPGVGNAATLSAEPAPPVTISEASGTGVPVLMPLVLVAEDNEDNRIIAATMLRHSGYRVIEATTGAEAMHLARTESPALILMDVGMPDIDGWSATRILKDDPATRRIVILAFTAHALPGDRDHAREAGCDGYLAKPVEPLRLVREVGRALAEFGGHASPAQTQ